MALEVFLSLDFTTQNKKLPLSRDQPILVITRKAYYSVRIGLKKDKMILYLLNALLTLLWDILLNIGFSSHIFQILKSRDTFRPKHQ